MAVLSTTVAGNSVIGDMRIVWGESAGLAAAGWVATGLNYVHCFMVTSQLAPGSGSDFQVVKNSQDATDNGSDPGDVFLDMEADATVDWVAIGK